MYQIFKSLLICKQKICTLVKLWDYAYIYFAQKKNSYVLPLQKFTGESREGPAPLEIQY